MNILYLSSLITFITFILCQPSLSQSLSGSEAQKLLMENPSILENIKEKQSTEVINKKLTSENQNVANSSYNPQQDVAIAPIPDTSNEQSLSTRYYRALTGQDLNIYGLNEFNQQQNEDLLFFNTIGNDYQLGPGDTIQIIIIGLSALNETYQVMNDGTISLENIYPINVNNMTLDEVSKLILDKIKLDDASAEVLVRLNTARLVTVQISGNVNSPRTIAVPAYTPLSRVIGYSGGISDNGSLRSIALSQFNEITQNIDFYDYLQSPSVENDPLIKNGARIFVPNKGSTIAALGFVSKPGIYELPNNKPNMTINELLAITGTSFLPLGASLKVLYFDSNGQLSTRIVGKNDQVKKGEALQVDFIETRNLNTSKISGAVVKDYEIKTNVPLSIKEVLKGGAVLNNDIFTSFALIDGKVGKDIQAINLDIALEDESITLPVGSDLRLFTKKKYLELVASDPNKSLNPIVSKLSEANVAEIYLNGVRVAYVPLSQKQKRFSIREILSVGSIIDESGYFINNDIFTSFALIDGKVGKDIQAINLDTALEDESITLPVGSDLRLFTKKKYLELVASDPNKSLNPIVSKLSEANVAEIYLNGVRVAYVPIRQGQGFYDSIKPFYTPTLKTVYDISLIQNDTYLEAFDLKLAMRADSNKKLLEGDRLLVFEEKFFNQLLSSQVDGVFSDIGETEGSNQTTALNVDLEAKKLKQDIKDKKLKYSEEINFTRRIIQKSNITKIYLDGELLTILPFLEGMTSSYILSKLKGKLPKLVNEFVIIQNTDKNLTPKIKNLKYEFHLEQNQEINLISRGTYQKIISGYNSKSTSRLMNDVRTSDAVKVYLDHKLVLLLSPNVHIKKQDIFYDITNTDEFYKLYIGLITKQKNSINWDLQSYNASEFFSDSQNIKPGESNIVYIFSEQFIREKFVDSTDTQNLLFDNNEKNNFEDKSIEIAELTQSNDINSSYIFHDMDSKLRVISGAVMFPGSYPLADRTRLKDLVDVGGVIDAKAGSNVVISMASNINDILVKSSPKVIKLSSLTTDKTILSGNFYVDVPKAVNEAISGFINLSGEFNIPGDYAFSRSEPLTEIIQRAGGITDTAYPLGAVLIRESIKIQEKESNDLLANQLEASVISLAQSDIDGADEQIKAILGFAQQLRNQKTTGRMSINIMDTNNNLYLQDGDKLMLPKRPSHVSVVGAVQRTTVSGYNKSKTIDDYITSAGGLTNMADIRRAYLLLPNGESRIVTKNTIIPVGSVVVIPPKIDKLSILGLTDVISRVLGNIAVSILAINNVN